MKAATLERRRRKVRAATPCWRCKELLGEREFGSAVLRIEYADGSYSGTFAVPLCLVCLCAPHQDGLTRIEE
jgi:hypothetical protein